MPIANSSRVGGKVAFITGAIIPADGGLLAHQTYSADLGAVMQAGT